MLKKLFIRSLLFLISLTMLSSAQYVRTNKFANEQLRRATYALDDFISYTSSRRFTVMTAGTNYIYIGTKDGGILRYHIYDNYWDYPFTTSNGLPSNNIQGLVYDRTSSFLWAFTPDDVAVLNPASQEWIVKSQSAYWGYELPEQDSGRDRRKDSKGKFYGRDALPSLPTFFANGDYSILGDWILMDRDFREFPIIGYLRDRYDRVWFLVDGFGIGVGEMYNQRASFYKLGLPDISPRAIAYQGDDLWFGGVSGNYKDFSGIALWPYDQPGWQYYQDRYISHLPSDNVFDILVDSDSVWFATDYGVTLYDRGNNRWRNFSLAKGVVSNQIYDLAIFDDYLYAATEEGISRIDLATSNVRKVKDHRFRNLPVYGLVTHRKALWAATFRGIFRFTAEKGWEQIQTRSAINELEVTAVDGYRNEVWFASDGGVSVYNIKTDDWESYPQVGYEISGPYKDIKVNKKAVFVATQDGLLKFDKERRYWILFTTEDGLLDNYCHQLLLDGDYIWIVSDSGVTQFYWNSPDRSD